MGAAVENIALASLQRRLPETRAGRVCETLCAVYPERIAAKHLMLRAGLRFHADPVGSFVELCASFYDINRFLRPFGWQVSRTGGTPDDFYWLTPGGAG